MVDRRIASATATRREAAGGRSAGRERDLLDSPDRLALAGPARALRPLHHGLQPLQSLGETRHLAAHLRGPGPEGAGRTSSDRLLDREGPPTRRRRKKRGPDHAIGRSRGGLTTKLHAVVNEDGLPVRFVITPGQVSDKTTAPELLDGLELAPDIVADRGYSATALIDWCAARGSTAHIPSQRNVRVVRTVPAHLYRLRNLVERYFNKLKHFRRVATRFDKLAANFMAAVALASIRLWLRHHESTT
jgi:transposase